MIFTEWLYQHKTLLITTIILLCGGISGVFVLAKEEEKIEQKQKKTKTKKLSHTAF